MELSLNEIRSGILSCNDCGLRATCERPVPGYGPSDAKVLVVGEAPGYWEEKNGQPFVGASGKFLTNLFSSIGFSRKNVYFANTVNCRPPENRDPKPEEMSACRHWVEAQIESVDPKVVLTMGRFSAKLFFPPSSTITVLHGSARYDGKRAYMAMYHPAAALHNPSLRVSIENDFRKFQEILFDLKILN